MTGKSVPRPRAGKPTSTLLLRTHGVLRAVIGACTFARLFGVLIGLGLIIDLATGHTATLIICAAVTAIAIGATIVNEHQYRKDIS